MVRRRNTEESRSSGGCRARTTLTPVAMWEQGSRAQRDWRVERDGTGCDVLSCGGDKRAGRNEKEAGPRGWARRKRLAQRLEGVRDAWRTEGRDGRPRRKKKE